jgi:hypothetical protein
MATVVLDVVAENIQHEAILWIVGQLPQGWVCGVGVAEELAFEQVLGVLAGDERDVVLRLACGPVVRTVVNVAAHFASLSAFRFSIAAKYCKFLVRLVRVVLPPSVLCDFNRLWARLLLCPPGFFIFAMILIPENQP